MFLCGHDSNLASIGAALRFVYPETQNALELHTPIGSKLVFEKWSDGTDDYVAVNLVYPKYRQLQNRTLLSLDEPPMVRPVTIEGLTANADGLYRLEDLNNRMAEAMAEYDAIEDIPTSIPAASTRAVTFSEDSAYTLGGIPATDTSRGVIIKNKRKIIKSKR
jgi:glucose-1-phosphatase